MATQTGKPALASQPLPINRDWRLANLRKPRAELIEAVRGATTVPAAAKALLIEGINALAPEVELVQLDAHGRFVNGMLLLNITIKPL